MHDPLLVLVAAAVTLLCLSIAVFFVLLIVILFMLRNTLAKVQKAVDDVEKTALRSLIPLMGIKNMFSDLEGFVSSVKAWVSILTGKKTDHVDKMVKEKK